jgi:DNA-directed RNA polymerase specialized sigma24 family protein
VEVLGRYSNHADQGERIAEALGTAPEHAKAPKPRTQKRVRRRLTDADATDLAEAYKNGATTYELAERFGIYRDRVSLILEQHVVPRRMQSLTAEQIQQAVALYGHGLSIEKVAHEIGCGKGTIWKELRMAGVQLRRRPGW